MTDFVDFSGLSELFCRNDDYLNYTILIYLFEIILVKFTNHRLLDFIFGRS